MPWAECGCHHHDLSPAFPGESLSPTNNTASAKGWLAENDKSALSGCSRYSSSSIAVSDNRPDSSAHFCTPSVSEMREAFFQFEGQSQEWEGQSTRCHAEQGGTRRRFSHILCVWKIATRSECQKRSLKRRAIGNESPKCRRLSSS